MRAHRGVRLFGGLLLFQVWQARSLFHFLQCWHVCGLCVMFCSISTMEVRVVLLGWLLCREGCLIWVFRRYKIFMQSVKICAGSLAY